MDAPEINHTKKWKYAKPEIERRFLLKEAPENLGKLPFKRILDKYVHDTRLRIRKTSEQGQHVYKLTKKVPMISQGQAIQWTSTIYLSESEYEVFMTLPGKMIRKKRYYFSHADKTIGIDEVRDGDKNIWIAEIEFEEGESLDFSLPFNYLKEISNDPDYQGDKLANRFKEA